jgi:hypothetical protein
MDTPAQNSPCQEQNLPPIPPKGVILAFQLAAFRLKHPQANFDAPTTDYIDFIYASYPPPDFSAPAWNTSNWITTSIVFPLTRDNQSRTDITKLCHNSLWALDRPTLNKDVTTFLNVVEPLLLRDPFFQNWQRLLGADFHAVNPLGRTRTKAKATRSRAVSEAASLRQPATNLTTEEIITPSVEPTMNPQHPPQTASTASPALDLSAVLAQLSTQQAQFATQIAAQLSTQKAELSTQLDGVTRRLDSLEAAGTHHDRSVTPPLPPPSRGSHSQNRPLERPSEIRECNIPGWKPADIGFFYPDMPYTWGTAEVVDKEDKVYYRSVYAFTNRLRVAAQTKDPAKMSSNLDTCFRGEAARWWNNEVDELVRGGLIHTRDINNWCRVLEERFKLPPSQAMDRLDNIHYTIRDAANRRSVTAYISSIVAAAKQCGETTEFQQVLRAWRHLDLALRAAIDEPKEGTTVKTFMDTLLAKQSNWFDIARRLNRRNDVHDVYTSDRRQPPYGRTTGQWRDGNFPRPYQRNDRYLSPFVANSYDYQFNPAIQTNLNPQSLQRNPTYGQDQPYDQKPQSSSQDPNTNRRTPPVHQPLPPPPQRPMISDKPFNRAEPDPRTRWRQQGPPQISPRRATAYSGAQYDDEQEFYGAQGYNLDDGHSDDLPDGDYPLEESYANYSDSPTNSKAVN